MKYKLFFLMFIASTATATFYKAPQPTKFEGDQPYTPTKLEWLTTYESNECQTWLSGIPTVSWGLFALADSKDTITVTVHWTDEAVRTEAQQAAETCARNIRAVTHDRGWNWVKTEIQAGNRDGSKNPKGYKLSTVIPGNPVEKLGLKAGDIIKTINGKPVNGATDLNSLADLFKTADKVRVEYVRDGDTRAITSILK